MVTVPPPDRVAYQLGDYREVLGALMGASKVDSEVVTIAFSVQGVAGCANIPHYSGQDRPSG